LFLAIRVFSAAFALLAAVFAWHDRAEAVSVPPYQQVFGAGFAAPPEVENALGRLTYSITACRNEAVGMPSRSVSVTSEKSEYEDRRVVETVLYWATLYAWRACPLPVIWGMVRPLPQPRFEVKSIELYLPDGGLAIRATGLSSAMGPYRWATVEDVGAAQREMAARQAAQQEQAQQLAQARQAEEDQSRRDAEEWSQRRDRWAAWSRAHEDDAKQIAIGVGALIVSMALWRKRTAILRWYFFNFHPHPAEPMVRAALRGGALDGNALASALGEVPSRNSILRDVRIVQGERLVERMSRVSERTIKRDLARAREDHERAAFHGVQEAIALAAVALERARASHATSKLP